MADVTPDVTQLAAELLRQDPRTDGVSQDQVVKAAKWLKKQDRFADAASLFNRARGPATPGRAPSMDVYALGQEAECTSKDQALGAEKAFRAAIKILDGNGLGDTNEQELLGIAGGIYKRHWDTFRQFDDLQQALAYYERGWRAGGVADNGYTGINAAYVADVLAYLDETNARRANAPATNASQLWQRAQAIRKAIVADAAQLETRITPGADGWWILVTLAEAYFGLALDDPAYYAEVKVYLSRAMALPDIDSWMKKTTARQLAAMARIHERMRPAAAADSRPWEVLDPLMRTVPGLRTELGGKVGLALSGGGFRASLFHIGVLARLAELDLLRHVEVLSCVSGGSILGAMYYLRLRDLLNGKRDDQIRQDDYIHIVQRLEEDFLAAIQQNNFRMRMLESVGKNWAMLKSRGSRTEAMGQAMGEVLYGSSELSLHELTIEPPDAEPRFRPGDYNWRRKNKVPLLVLNATNQAGGHGWHFTPYEMGEPQLSEIDSNPRLAPQPLVPGHSVHLWRAVSASACVPVLFEPIKVAFGSHTVDLLDGGVHDNQGTSALLANDCTLLLVSDASGQLDHATDASTSFAAVGVRADSIVQERLRIALYEALESRRRGSLLRGMMFLHLRLGLKPDERTPTDYGMPTGVQRRLSSIRTDLDVFNDAEALGLMLSGYLMTTQQMPVQLRDVDLPQPASPTWQFQQVTAAFASPTPRLMALLDLGASRFLKAWRAVPELKWLGRAMLAAALLAAFGWLVVLAGSEDVIPVRKSAIAWSILGAIGAVLLQKFLRIKVPNWKQELAVLGTAAAGALVVWIHSKWLDPRYIKAGQRDGLAGPRKTP